MKKLFGLVFSATLLAPSLAPLSALANYEEYLSTAGPQEEFGSCGRDPIYEHDWSGTVTTGARVRNVACMDGSTVLTTLAVGTKVRIIAETDGWYKVKLADGTRGWVGQWLLQKSESPLSYSEGTYTEKPTILSTQQLQSIRERLKGYVLLQVEKNGEAWYVNPKDGLRHYMKDGSAAYEIMRKLGLGISEEDYMRLKEGNLDLRRRLLGKIMLRVKAKGEAYYVSPKDGSLVYLKDGAAAYELLRKYGLGITNGDLDAITKAE
jgi:hypothetical protein